VGQHGGQDFRMYDLVYWEVRMARSRGRTTVPRAGVLVRILSFCSRNKTLGHHAARCRLNLGLDFPENTQYHTSLVRPICVASTPHPPITHNGDLWRLFRCIHHPSRPIALSAQRLATEASHHNSSSRGSWVGEVNHRYRASCTPRSCQHPRCGRCAHGMLSRLYRWSCIVLC
jgi:hypothetical protein